MIFRWSCLRDNRLRASMSALAGRCKSSITQRQIDRHWPIHGTKSCDDECIGTFLVGTAF
jgi:hypothetical protein